MESYEDIYQVVKLIPCGRVTNYGAIAKYIGTAPRVVGWALNSLQQRADVPAHRVVNRNGLLTGKHHFETPSTMQERLESEGLSIKDNQIIDFPSHYWDPQKELL